MTRIRAQPVNRPFYTPLSLIFCAGAGAQQSARRSKCKAAVPLSDQEASPNDHEKQLDPEKDDEPCRDGVVCPSDDEENDMPAGALHTIYSDGGDADDGDDTGSAEDEPVVADSAAATDPEAGARFSPLARVPNVSAHLTPCA